MNTSRYLALLLLMSSCATPGKDEPRALCQSVTSELDQCTDAVQDWRAEQTGERPACVAESEPAVARMTDAAGQAYPDDPESRQELARVAKNLEMIHRFLQRDKTVEARLLLSKIEDRCAALP